MTWELTGPALLFCPADRPERFSKAAAMADVVILDLEDGVSAADRTMARSHLSTTLLDPATTIVRINPVGSEEHALDLEALARTPYVTVMLAKTESPEEAASLEPRQVVALCETAAGVVRATSIAAVANVVALMWGAEDLIASLGGLSSRFGDGTYRDVARSARTQVLLAAGAYQKVAIDAVHLDIGDLEGLRLEALDGLASGFSATACIHPSQVNIVREAFLPTLTEIEWARRVIEASRSQRGVFTFEGQMVDAPVFRQAEAILSRSARYRTV